MFVTSLVHTKLCLLQTIPYCKGEQNYEGVTLFVRTDIYSGQDQMTVCAADSDSYTESNISHVSCDVKVWCHKKHAAIQKQCFLLAIKSSFVSYHANSPITLIIMI